MITERLEARRAPFMPGAPPDSQFATPEPFQADEYGSALPVSAAPEDITAQAAAVTGRFRPDTDTERPENSMECSHGSN